MIRLNQIQDLIKLSHVFWMIRLVMVIRVVMVTRVAAIEFVLDGVTNEL